MKSIKETIKHINVTLFEYLDFGETDYILHDTKHDMYFVGTGGYPSYYDSTEEFEDDFRYGIDDIRIHWEYDSLTKYLEGEAGVDANSMSDEEILDAISESLGEDICEWVRDILPKEDD